MGLILLITEVSYFWSNKPNRVSGEGHTPGPDEEIVEYDGVTGYMGPEIGFKRFGMVLQYRGTKTDTKEDRSYKKR